MTEPPRIVRPSDAELEALGITWVELAGATASGLPYPASSDPVANGAANIQALADAVTLGYPTIGRSGVAMYPQGAAIPAGKRPIMLAGFGSATIPTAGYCSWAIPGAAAFTTALVSFVVTALHNGPGKYLVALARGLDSVYLYGTVGTAAAPNGTAYSFSYVAIGY